MQNYSVIIPAYNAARTLSAALESVASQVPAPSEIIVVDDGSTDETAQIAQDFGGVVRVIRQKNAGPGAATTAGVNDATNDILAFVDADDLWLAGKIAQQLAHFEKHGAMRIICTRMRQFRHGQPDDGTGEERDGLSRSTLLTTRTAFDTIGPIIDPPGQRGDMVDWLARARTAGYEIDVLPDVLALRRILPGSMSWGRDHNADRGYLFAARAAMLRKRAGKPE